MSKKAIPRETEKTKVIRFWYMEEYAAKGTNPWRTEDGYRGTGGNPPQRKVTFEEIHTVIPRTITCKLDNVTSDTINLILSRLVDTFSSRILYPMLLLSGNHSIAVV